MSSDNNESNLNALGYPKLRPASKVPSDIEISQSIVNDVGLLPVHDLAKQLRSNVDVVVVVDLLVCC